MPAHRTGTHAICAHCRTTFWVVPSTIAKGGGRFCSHACRVAFKRDEALAQLREPLATRLPNGCLIAPGWKNDRGYGRLLGGKSGRKPAHVLSWEMANGREFPDGMFGCHSCDTPPCVEPSHIWPGTIADNTADMVAKGRSARGTRNTNAKLTDDIVREIRMRHQAGGVTMTRLAAEYGVTKALVSYVVRGLIWRHVVS